MKEKKKRGIRKPRGYVPGDFNRNLYVAEHEYIKGNELVAGEAVQFFGDCKTYSDLMLLALTERGEVVPGRYPGQSHRVKSHGYNKSLMKYYRMKKSRVDQIPHCLAFDICEQILRAVQTGDDWFFRDLGRLCKFEKVRPTLSLEYWLGILHRSYSKDLRADAQNNCFTAPELCQLAFARGFKYGQKNDESFPVRRMHELCKKLGIKLLDGRKGEPRSDFQRILQQIKSAIPVVVKLAGKKPSRESEPAVFKLIP